MADQACSATPPGRNSVADWARLVFWLFVLAAAVILFYRTEDSRGVRDWERYRADHPLEDWRSSVFVPVLPRDNFLAAPILERLVYRNRRDAVMWAKFEKLGVDKAYEDRGDFWLKTRTDFGAIANAFAWKVSAKPAAAFLGHLQPAQQEIAELEAASRRPQSVFPTDPSDYYEVDHPNYTAYALLAKLFVLRSSAHVDLGQAGEAFDDLRVVRKLVDGLSRQPSLAALELRGLLIESLLQPFWEGEMAHLWSDEQLQMFAAYFPSINLLASYDRAVRCEQAGVTEEIEDASETQIGSIFFTDANTPAVDAIMGKMRMRLAPTGWRYQNIVVFNRLVNQFVCAGFDVPARRVYPVVCDRNAQALTHSISTRSPYHHLARIALSTSTRPIRSMARLQTALDEARVSIDWERYLRRHHAYPASLDVLASEYRHALPKDIVTGDELHSAHLQDDAWIIYSVGWDQKDDHGTPSKLNSTDGDWPWPLSQSY